MLPNFYLSFLNAATLVLVATVISAQSINIEIDNTMFTKTERALFIVSDDYGNVNYINDIYPPFKPKDFSIKLAKENKEEKHHFTIINVVLSKKENKAPTYYPNATTFYDIPNHYKLENNDRLRFKYYQKPQQEILIKINGVSQVDDIYIGKDSPHEYERIRIRKGTLKIQTDVQTGFDLFGVLYCNGEENPKYFYLPADSIPSTLELDWANLEADLYTKKIKLPKRGEWRIKISARNEDTQNIVHLCDFYQQEDVESVSVYIPKKMFFYEFYTYASHTVHEFEERKTYSYNIFSDTIPEIYDYNGFSFEYDFRKMENNRFQIFCSEEEMGFGLNIDFHYKNSYKWNGLYYVREGGNWYISGDLDDFVDFRLPIVSKYYSSKFELFEKTDLLSFTRINILKKINPNYTITFRKHKTR